MAAKAQRSKPTHAATEHIQPLLPRPPKLETGGLKIKHGNPTPSVGDLVIRNLPGLSPAATPCRFQ